ncbi:uncharacterized protein [Arachis hypogaea]|uniref:uncharacterized protein n=1 Tax=Arachis hypogaea TaxID=3818 RepID=UPI000DECDF6D|nr:uncharacterized protein LOC112757188 [Arachis hypogaea]
MGKLEGWKERLLNQAGKETLIKSVIQAMPSYAMNIIKFSKSFCRRICSKVARLYWATSGKERGIHWRKWDSITDSKSSVGLGFKDLEKHNIAYLAKQAWRAMKNPDAIWVQVLKSIYFPDENFWAAKCKKGAPWVWRSILHGRELLRERARWSIGDGSNVSIWKDNWITGRSKPLDAYTTDDSKEDGSYSIRTGYYVAKKAGQDMRNGKPSTSEDKKEIWKEEDGTRPIMSDMLKRDETVEHALLLCDWARATWFGAECQWTPTAETVNSIGSWMVECIRKIIAGGGDDQEKRISKLGFLLWEIWKTRNNKLFQKQEVNPSWTISRARMLETVYGKLVEKQQTQKIEANRSRTFPVSWRPPPETWLKANVDAAFRKDNGTGTIAVVIRDS